MYFNDKRDLRLLPDLLRDNDYPQLKTISDVNKLYTFDATGVNVGYILFLNHKVNSDYKIEKYPIDNIYQNIFDKMRGFSIHNKTEDFNKIISYIKSTELIETSRQFAVQTDQLFFSYCITLSDRYIPKIYLDIDQRLNIIIGLRNDLDEYYFESKVYIEKKYEVGYYKDQAIKRIETGYLENKKELHTEVCNYIALWIHAYRFFQARKDISSQESIISYSHRYQGWSKPKYKFNDDLTVEFITNFGYGNSSYFYLLLIYKGIQIFPFMDWINYKYAKVSEMEKYTEKYHKELMVEVPRGKTSKHQEYSNEPITKRTVVIEQKYWGKALTDLVKACMVCEAGADAFIQEYITSALDSLVDKLEEVFEIKEKASAKKYRDFDYGFSKNQKDEDNLEKIVLMSVKGTIISGTLDFMVHVIKLKEIIDTEVYIKKIEALNLRILPMLQETKLECQKINYDLTQEIGILKNKLIEIWVDKGLKEYTHAHRINTLSEEDESNFEDLKQEHKDISAEKNEEEQKLENSIKILKSIERYISNIEKYFSLTR